MAESIRQSRGTTSEILIALQEARTRTLDLIADLSDEQLIGPRLRIVNPLRWEIGHIAYFQEIWCLRHFLGRKPILANSDKLYDSALVHRDTRWDLPASCEPSSHARSIGTRKRVYPWGNEPPTADRANLDWFAMGCIDVDALPSGDSGFGCRQMIGNTWEWTSTTSGAYPGFEPGPYKEYSARGLVITRC